MVHFASQVLIRIIGCQQHGGRGLIITIASDLGGSAIQMPIARKTPINQTKGDQYGGSEKTERLA
jgi:hypothetical protein